MSNAQPSKFDRVFPIVPVKILENLETSYNSIKKNFREKRFEPSELNGGKFCEAVFRLLEWHTSTQYTPFGSIIHDFSKVLKKFENLTKFPDSVRFHIPRILDALYGIRNKRGVGHLGGDVNPNLMDAVFVVSATDWIMAEIVRLFHGITIEEAQRLVQNLVTKKIPIIWSVDDRKRVLSVDLSFKDKMLVLLYDEYPRPLALSDLFRWIEHSNLAVFKRDILRPCHDGRLIEYDQGSNSVRLSPLGLAYVEKEIKLEMDI